MNPVRGFTLTELLVAMALSTLLIAGAGQVLASVQRHARLIAELADMQAAGRHALALLGSEVRQAGYFGEATGLSAESIDGSALATGRCTPADWGRHVTIVISGANDVAQNPTGEDASCVPRESYLRGDVLTVRYAAPVSAEALRDAANAHRLYLVPAPEQTRIAPGGSASAAAAATNPWRAYELAARSYFVGKALDSSTDAHCATNATPALMRMTLDARGLPVREEVLRNVEHLQIRFGIDTDDDGSVDTYVNPDALGDGADVVSIRLWLLIRSHCPDGSYTNSHSYILGDRRYTTNDHFRRALLTTTVALRRHSEAARP